MMLMAGGAPSIDWLFDHGSAASVTVINSETTTPTVRINPFLEGDSTQWFAVRLRGYAGKTPTFLLDKTTLWTAYSASMWLGAWATSADTDTWNQFDNVSVGASDISMSMNTPFPGSEIYVALQPLYPFSRTQRLVAEWTGNALVGETASTTNKIISLSTALAIDGMGKAPANLPYYALKVSNATANTKNNAILTARQHACEPQGGYAFEGAMSWLLTTSVKQKFLLDWFNILGYPNLYPQNTWAGHSRSLWTDYSKDINSMWSTTGQSENIDVFKTAMAADSGGEIAVGIDHHAFVSATNGTMGDLEDTANAQFVAFKAEMLKLDAGYSELEESLPNALPHWWENTLGADLALHQEQLMGKSRTIADWKKFGENSMKALAAMQASGYFTNGPGTGARDFNGTTDRIDWESVFDTTGSALTVSVWVNLDAYAGTGVTNYILATHRSGDAAFGTVLAYDPSGRFQFFRNGTTLLEKVANSAIGKSAWVHLLVTHTGVMTSHTSVHLYRNGAEETYYSSINGAGEYAASGKWSLGGRVYDDARNVNGKIAQVGVWNRVLNSTEIANLAAGYAPSVIDSGLQFYFKGNTSALDNEIGGADGTADGTTQLTGAGTGPAIYYP
jgi:hypothetical protein